MARPVVTAVLYAITSEPGDWFLAGIILGAIVVSLARGTVR